MAKGAQCQDLIAWGIRLFRKTCPLPLLLNLIREVREEKNASGAREVSVSRLWKKYGDVVSLEFGWTNLVVLSGYKTLKEALVKKSEDFVDRPSLPIYEKFFEQHGEGIVFAKFGDWWNQQKKFSILTLKNFGLRKKTLKLQIVEEAEFLIQGFESEQGLPFDPYFHLTYATSNIICSIVFGERFDYSDKKFLQLLHMLEESFVLEGGFWGQLVNVFPFLYYLPGPQNKIFQNHCKMAQFWQEIIKSHKESWDPNYTRNFIDAFLTQQEKMRNTANTSFLENKMITSLLGLFAAGTETTSTTLSWGLLFMVLHPDVQSRVHEEIDRVIGKGRRPRLEDREEMPFTNAVIHETQRLGNIVPISLPHETYRDTTVMGYTIPKGTMIIPNISSALLDEDIWLTPHQFNPGHFLDSDGKFVKPEAFIPFSAGHRMCLGEQLAKTELFIFFTSMLQRFTLFLPANEARPSYKEARFGITLCPLPYRLCVKAR
ncbi:cytochrome P450 2J2-like [Mobula birostris]|uniref:cytochrome P450 2J2-like n=1 Tax=Mobula birostris TaxID=1983395 RepID=UPI003B2887CE